MNITILDEDQLTEINQDPCVRLSDESSAIQSMVDMLGIHYCGMHLRKKHRVVPVPLLGRDFC